MSEYVCIKCGGRVTRLSVYCDKCDPPDPKPAPDRAEGVSGVRKTVEIQGSCCERGIKLGAQAAVAELERHLLVASWIHPSQSDRIKDHMREWLSK